MARFSSFGTTYEPMELPPGFRFHPTDEELITHYLSPKVLDNNFATKAIGDADLNKVEPWDLPWKAKMGEKEWYFFCVRDRKYPTGLRTNRATEAGYWKATGKDKEIYRAKSLVGMKKTLVFYGGRAPRGEKSNWVMHEYRLEGNHFMHNLTKTTKNEWVICRVFKKSSGGKKVHISGLARSRECGVDLPPLMDLSCYQNWTRTVDELRASTKNNDFQPVPFNLPKVSNANSTFLSQAIASAENLPDQPSLRSLLGADGPYTKQGGKAEFSQDIETNTDISSAISNEEVGFKPYDDQDFHILSNVHVDFDGLWDY